MKTDVDEKKSRVKKEFLEENENKFAMYSEDDTNYDNNDFNKYYLDTDKSFNHKEAAIHLGNEMISAIWHYEIAGKNIKDRK